MERQGWQSVILTTDQATPLEHRHSNAFYFPVLISYMRNPLSLQYASALRRHSFDIMHLHSIWFLPSLFAAVFKGDAKIVTTVHGVFPDSASLAQRFGLFIYRPFASFVLNRSDHIVVLSGSEKEKLMRLFNVPEAKVKVISNGICLEGSASEDKQPTILFTGRINSDKNPEVLIRAGALIYQQIPELKICFAGPVEKDYKEQLVKLAKSLGIEKIIRFAGPFNQTVSIERKELMDLYRQAACFVALGSWEGLPTRLLEAMQFSTPCVTFASGGSSQLIINNKNGLVIDRLDEGLLAEALQKLFSDRQFAKKLGESARETVWNDYNWENIGRQLIELYQTL
ncbi:MAG TPA: glycosyltransferase family 4 protein [Candidatus Rifleibacterium sp.]|nr:glycosyltransferase family 4 protein [Candidatus Rifleibacterium sp.]